MIDFNEVAEAFWDIANTSSTLEKERLLVEYAELEGFKEIMRFVYNPYIRTGIGIAKLEKGGVSDRDYTVEEVLEYFSITRTGNYFDVCVASDFVYGQETEEAAWLAEKMMIKDLQIGVSVTTLNKVYGKSFIPIVGIMRGMPAPQNMKGIYIATEKIDGNRRLIMNKETGVEIYTRSGRRDNGLVEIEEQAKCLPTGFVYDTEIAAVGDYANSLELRQATASIANSKGKRTGVKALVFDMIKQADYDNGISKLGALGRKTLLASVFSDYESLELLIKYFIEYDAASGGTSRVSHSINALSRTLMPASETPNIMALPILDIVETYDDAVKLAQPIWDTGGEGIMLVEWRSPYEVNPNPRKTLLKIKANYESVCQCVAVLEGDNKYAGTLGAITVEYYRPDDDKTYYVNVGSGFTDFQRDMFWSDPSLIVGRPVEIEHFGETINKGGSYSLNCPIFKRVQGEKE